MDQKELIREAGLSMGLHDLRFTTAEPLAGTAGIMRDRVTRGLRPPERAWRDAELELGCNPGSFLDGARSVIVAALCYKTEEDDGELSGALCGEVAPHARRNYYRILKKILKKLAGQIRQIAGRGRFFSSSNGLIREKPLAMRSGLGFYGRHGIIVSPRWGSMTALGTIVTDLELSPDLPCQDACSSCEACIKKCPAAAIPEPGVIDERRCLQSLSQVVSMPPELREIWGTRLYGCAECHVNCPRNVNVPTVKPLSDQGRAGAMVPLIPVLGKSDGEIREMFRGNQMGANWLPPAALRKNACLALGNHRDPAAQDALYQALVSEPDMLGEYAAWALWRIGGASSRNLLEKALAGIARDEARVHIAGYLERF